MRYGNDPDLKPPTSLAPQWALFWLTSCKPNPLGSSTWNHSSFNLSLLRCSVVVPGRQPCFPDSIEGPGAGQCEFCLI